jgi:DNA-binding response OmpR family regulator
VTPSILLLEDDDGMAEATVELLTSEGYQVVALQRAELALDYLVVGYRPDAMIVDIGLPGMSGDEFLRICRRDPQFAGIPAIIVSGHEPGTLAVGEVPDQAFLQKPFPPAALLGRLRAMVGRF